MRKLRMMRRLFCLLLAAALCLTLAAPIYAEDTASDDDLYGDLYADDTVAEETEEVSEAESTAAPETTAVETTEAPEDEDDNGVTGMEKSASIDNEDFNLVLLIDRSGSMKSTDRSKLVKDAAKMFIDLCDEGGNSHIAVMSFDTMVYNSGFITVSNAYQREVVKNEISSIDYAAGGTDIGQALLSAVQFVCGESEPDQKKMIVLFTDGYTQDLNDKTIEESESELQLALKTAVENDCRIFTLGTNYNGSMTENGRKALEGIRDYQIANGATNSPEELLAIIDATDQDGMKVVVDEFERIYATIGERIIHEGNLIIDSPNISEANIIISAPDGVSEIKITAPSGNSVFVDLHGNETHLDGAKIIYKSGNSYQLIKIVEPIAEGTWVLNVSDKQSEPILNYTWMLTTKAEISMTLEQNGKESVLVIIRPKNVDVNNLRDFFSSLTEKTVVVTKKGSKESLTLDLDYNLLAASLTASFPAEPGSTYSVKARVSDGYFTRTCTGSIKSQKDWKDPNEKGPDIGTIYVWNWFSKTIELRELVDKDVKGLESIDGARELAEFEINGTRIKVRSVNLGSGEIVIKGVMADGSEVELSGKVKVLNPLFPLLLLVALVGVIVLLVYLKRQKRSLRGKLFFKFGVSLNGEGSYALPEVFVPCCRVFSLYELIESYRRDTMKDNWDAVLDKKVLNKNSPYFKALKNSKFTVCSDELSFEFDGTVYRRHDTEFEWISEDGLLTVTFVY